MRSHLALLGFCLLLVVAGCNDAGETPTPTDELPDVESTPSPTTTPTSTPASNPTPTPTATATPTPTATATPTLTPTATPTPTPTATPTPRPTATAPPTPTPEESPTEEPTTSDGELEVHAINVGQADATLVVTETETMLIDSGDWRDDGATVIEYLESRGVDRIDHLVSTHGHADHIGGHAAIIDHYETEKEGIGAVYDNGVPHTSQTYERYLDAVERHDVDLFEVGEGDEIPFDGVGVTVLNPEEPGGDDLHYDSVSIHITFGEASFLFTGDAERDAEARMVDAHGEALAADVYHAGHHGSDTSSTAEFLDVVDPEVAIISSAYDSQYGHPHEEPLERFAERDILATWTGVHGTIVFVTDGNAISVRTQHDAPTAPLELRSAPGATAAPGDEVGERFIIEDTETRVAPVSAHGSATS